MTRDEARGSRRALLERAPRRSPPPRLFVLLARDGRTGLVLRRGPSRWTQLVAWDRHRDSFTPGHWFHGNLYARRCDLSPDGELLVYFAAKHQLRSTEFATWTAVSRPPHRC